MTALKGRILRRDVGHLHAAYQQIRGEVFNAIEPTVRQQVFDIVNAWAAPRWPLTDLAVLRRYGLIDDVAAVNVTAWNEETSRWDLRYGFQFPKDQTIPMPSKPRYGGGTYRSVYAGGARLERDQDQIDELLPFCRRIELQRAVFNAELSEFNAFVGRLPLKRDLATCYPDVFKQVEWRWKEPADVLHTEQNRLNAREIAS